MINKAQWAMIVKDIKEMINSPQSALPMLLVPAILMVVMPAVVMIGAQFGVSGINGMDQLVNQLSSKINYKNDSQMMVDIAINYMFPAMFMMVPVMAASVMGASSFIGEKEHKTFESLLYTPMTLREIFVSKVIGTSIVAYAVALISVILFGVVVDVGGYFYFGMLIFPNIKWLLLILWVAPALTMFSISFMVILSAKAKTFQEAQQMSGFIVVPLVLLIVGQSTGLFMLNEILLIGIGGVTYVVDYFLMKNAIDRYHPERLL